MKINKGFSMLEMLFVMAVMAGLASVGIPTLASQNAAELSEANKVDMLAFIKQNDKIVEIEGSAPIFEFSASSTNKTHVETANSIDYKYTLSWETFTLQSVQIKNGATGEYTSFGLIINTGATNPYHDCYVFNSESDSKPLMSDDCTPDSLGWDYKDTY